ncbi:MAG: hypothetical protein E7F13_05915, partial [Megasphaera sp.]|nr:hypothetical protein [Megasphaera sp.]
TYLSPTAFFKAANTSSVTGLYVFIVKSPLLLAEMEPGFHPVQLLCDFTTIIVQASLFVFKILKKIYTPLSFYLYRISILKNL